MIELLNDKLKAAETIIPEHAELVVDAYIYPEQFRSAFCGYYLVDSGTQEQPSRTVFWADKIPARDLICEFVHPVLSLSHLGTRTSPTILSYSPQVSAELRHRGGNPLLVCY